tara:strand:- start:374 stop:607 length:234 start_codon:yes stop_codon:yes gene_type:complete
MKVRQERKNNHLKKITNTAAYIFFISGISNASIHLGILEELFGNEVNGDELKLACLCFFLSSLCFAIITLDDKDKFY